MTRRNFTFGLQVFSDSAVRDTPPADLTLGQELDALGDDVFEMANLPETRTGIPGIIFISTAMASHGPRVKYFEKAGRDQPSFSVSISETPQVVANSLPAPIVSRYSRKVVDWVLLNQDLLLHFWNNGDKLMDDEVEALKKALKSI